MAGHTPGPWRISARQEDVERIDIEEVTDAEYTVASAWGGGHVMEAAMGANARLIAAAPELVKELRVMVQRYMALCALTHSTGDIADTTSARALLARMERGRNSKSKIEN